MFKTSISVVFLLIIAVNILAVNIISKRMPFSAGVRKRILLVTIILLMFILVWVLVVEVAKKASYQPISNTTQPFNQTLNNGTKLK